MRGESVPPAGGKVLLAVVVFALLGMLAFYLVTWFFGIKPIVDNEKAETHSKAQETPR